MKVQKIVGWVLLGLLSAFMLMTAMGKFMATADSDMGKQFIKIGIFENRFLFGAMEIAIVLCLFVPRLATLGVLGAIGYWAGAMAVELSFKQPPFAPLVALTLVTGVAFLRSPELFARALGKQMDA
jgi:hypothetical protein